MNPYELDAMALLDVGWAMMIDGYPMVNRDKVIIAITEAWDEPPVYDPETFGTSARDQRLSAAAYKQAGGPAALRDPNAQVPESVRLARERLAMEAAE